MGAYSDRQSGYGAVAAETLDVSGVISKVTAGLVLSWRQHVLLPANVRIRAASVWQLLVFLLEASVFVLIGFSLRDVLERSGGLAAVAGGAVLPLVAVVCALIASRFVWVFGAEGVSEALRRAGLRREPPLGWRPAAVMGWAGMRGVVTLAAALTLPEEFPGHDFILLAAFATILVTVLIQGSSLGLVIRLLSVRRTERGAPELDLFAAERAVMRAQLAAVEDLARDGDEVIHPQLLRRYQTRVSVETDFAGTQDERAAAIAAHYDVIIGAVGAGRAELVRLHRAGRIDDDTLRDLEHDLDLEEMGAAAAKA
jgi:CPA1 family monovalent cation:H+ antiporter